MVTFSIAWYEFRKGSPKEGGWTMRKTGEDHVKESDLPGENADRPREIPKKGWIQIIKRVKSQADKDHISIVAAGIAYYAMFAIFPLLIALVSIYGLIVDPSTVERQINELTMMIPKGAASVIGEQLHNIVQASSRALGWSVVISIFAALWSAMKGTNALIEAVNIAYDENETRGFFKRNIISFSFTLGMVVFVLFALGMIAVIPIVLGTLGLGSTSQALISVLRWPILGGFVIVGLAILNRYGPDRNQAKWRWVGVGSIVSTVAWLLISWLFSYYVDNFGNYNKTYGSLAGVIILLLWLYISGYIILLGAELNSEMEHQTRKDSTIGEPKPMGERQARKADTIPQPQ